MRTGYKYVMETGYYCRGILALCRMSEHDTDTASANIEDKSLPIVGCLTMYRWLGALKIQRPTCRNRHKCANNSQ